VSEKTGYPTEMLELNMDMEADLGIDSIKRVEIFGALTKQHPEMSGINPNELTELRTLAEIVNYVGANSGASNGTVVEAAPKVATPISAAPSTPVSNIGGIDVDKLTASLLQVVSEKTGYPTEMLELNMDMEADLGIDSIKRVEIFGALTKQHPEMSGINPNELTELRTLAEIVNYVGANSGASNGAVVEAAPKVAAPTTAAPSTPVSNIAGIDVDKLTASLLQVVSEKTGYPTEMLELNMDMEADLGIDSIKRVEIFGALTKQHPEMSGINPNELTELRTLAEIVNYVGANSGASNGTVVEAAPKVATPISAAPSTPVSNIGGIDVDKLTASLLQVVSEKTGYPTEMLELNMDMEADLGIDSIKRVEIFGALTKQHPEMSDINPNELTELRTLAEIVSYVSSHVKKKVMA
jgi:acyl carrier protein